METKTLKAAQLRERMARRGLTVKQVAQASGIARPNISAIFSGRQYLGRERAQRIAAALETVEARERSAR